MHQIGGGQAGKPQSYHKRVGIARESALLLHSKFALTR
jgi:hypothetical protein